MSRNRKTVTGKQRLPRSKAKAKAKAQAAAAGVAPAAAKAQQRRPHRRSKGGGKRAQPDVVMEDGSEDVAFVVLLFT